MTQLLREVSQELSARHMNPFRHWLWWAVDAWNEGNAKLRILQASALHDSGQELLLTNLRCYNMYLLLKQGVVVTTFRLEQV